MDAQLHLVLDFDGVAFHGFHHNPAYRRDWAGSIEADLGFPADGMPKFFGHPQCDNIFKGTLDLKEFLVEFFQEIGYRGDVEKFVSYWHDRDVGSEHLNRDLLGHVKNMRDRHQIKTYLATQQEPYRAQRIRTLGLSDHFDEMFFSCDFGILKTTPEYFKYVQKMLGLDPARDTILYFDDSPTPRAAAQQAGWRAEPYDTLEDFTGHPMIRPLISL